MIAIAVLALGGCSVGAAENVPTGPAEKVRVRGLPSHTVVLGSTDPAELALTAGQTFFEAAPVAVVSDAADPSATATAAALAVALSVPAFLEGGGISDDGIAEELRRLGAEVVVAVGEAGVATGDARDIAEAAGARVVPFETGSLDAMAAAAALGGAPVPDPAAAPDPAADPADPAAPVPLPDPSQLDTDDLSDLRAKLPDLGVADLLAEVMVLVDPRAGQEAAIGTVMAAGAVPFTVPGSDPGASKDAVRMLADAKALGVVGLGASFGSAEEFAWRVAAAESGVTLPTGSQHLFPARYVSTPYTVPLTSAGAPAEAPEDIVAEAVENAAAFVVPGSTTAADGVLVVPVVEVLAAARSSSAGSDGDYVVEQPAVALQPVIDAARAAGQLVLLDVAPGNVPLAEQVRELEPLLAQPGVGVSLHPEFRVAGSGATRAGRVDVAELQEVVDYLAGVVTNAELPQTLLVVHQSEASSVTGRATLALRPQVATVFAAAASGTGRPTARGVWTDVTTELPAGARTGWSAPSALPDDASTIFPTPIPDLVAAS
ncbi:hypothetical protein [Antribacter gilvus]|uniref:hypothetical protein n=1 Tax=Antribacter gilvus TaxID=2304675 RepID=UPI000F766B04|nr:hypothetical protein [Antribacter gilvus]